MEDVSVLLKSVPVVSRQELLFFLAAQQPPVTLRIATRAGAFHNGVVLSIGSARSNENIVMMQLVDDRGRLDNRFLHVDISSIESIELINPTDPVSIFSLGKSIKGSNYEFSGKLEIRRALQAFSEEIFNASGVKIVNPHIELPDDGQKLNRILKLTQKIQAVVIALFKDEDARTTWQSKFSHLAFVNAEVLSVKANGDTMEIHFAFENINAPDISEGGLRTALMAIL